MKLKLFTLAIALSLLPLLVQAQQTQQISLNATLNESTQTVSTASINTDLTTRTTVSVICIGTAKTYELTVPSGVVTVACTADPGITISTAAGVQVSLKVVPVVP